MDSARQRNGEKNDLAKSMLVVIIGMPAFTILLYLFTVLMQQIFRT